MSRLLSSNISHFFWLNFNLHIDIHRNAFHETFDKNIFQLLQYLKFLTCLFIDHFKITLKKTTSYKQFTKMNDTRNETFHIRHIFVNESKNKLNVTIFKKVFHRKKLVINKNDKKNDNVNKNKSFFSSKSIVVNNHNIWHVNISNEIIENFNKTKKACRNCYWIRQNQIRFSIVCCEIRFQNNKIKIRDLVIRLKNDFAIFEIFRNQSFNIQKNDANNQWQKWKIFRNQSFSIQKKNE